MLEAPRWGDAGWWARTWADARPRLLWLRIDAERVRIRWGMPVWALEESLRALFLLGPWFLWFARHLPMRLRRNLSGRVRGARFRLQIDLSGEPGPPPWEAGRALLEGAGEDMLRLPPGEPYVHIEAGRDVRIEIVSW
jgi:hypothetical protein